MAVTISSRVSMRFVCLLCSKPVPSTPLLKDRLVAALESLGFPEYVAVSSGKGGTVTPSSQHTCPSFSSPVCPGWDSPGGAGQRRPEGGLRA